MWSPNENFVDLPSQKNSCSLLKQNSLDESSTLELTPSAWASSESNDSVGNLGNLVHAIEHKIDTIVHIETYSDGRVVIRHDEIKLGNLSFTINGQIVDESKGMIISKKLYVMYICICIFH